MADTPPLPAGFEEVPTPQPTPSGMDAETYRSTLEHLVNTGASREQIYAFAQSAGYTPEQLHGIDVALDYRDKGGKGRIPVYPTQEAAPAITHQDAPAQEPPLPDGFEPIDMREHGLLDELGISGRSLANGLVSALDLAMLPAEALIAATDDPRALGMFRNKVDQVATDAGVAVPQTDAEKLFAKALEGASGAIATGGLGSLAGRVVPGVAGRALASLAEAPLAQAASGAGSGVASEYARQHGANGWEQLGAGLAGGGVPLLAAAGAGKLAGSVSSTLSGERVASPLMQAFDRQAVPALAADVGGTGTRMATGAANTTLGGIPLRAAAERSIEMARAARDRIAAQIGRVVPDATAGGNAAQSGAKRFLATTEQRGGQLYEAIPIEGATSATTESTKGALAQAIHGFESNPELSKLWTGDARLRQSLEALTAKETAESRAADMARAQENLAAAQQRAALNPDAASNSALAQAKNDLAAEVERAKTPLQDGSLSWEDMKRLRTIVGQIAGSPSLASDGAQKQAIKSLYGALSNDMRATAEAQGPKALAVFNRANAFWRARETRIENVITPILGKDLAKTPEAAFRQIESWAGDKGSFVRTAQALRSMPEDEANAIRATIFSRLGNAPAGGQNGAGEVFSPSTFITQWNKMPPNAKAVLFPGKEYQQDIADIVNIAEAQKAASKFANTSHTATAMHMAPGVGTTVALFHNPIALLAAAGSQFATGKLLASPAFARWLASAPKKPNAAAQLAHVNRLTKIATANPVIANDVLGLQEQLAKAFTGPQAVAAQEGQQ